MVYLDDECDLGMKFKLIVAFIVKCNARNSDNKANTGDRQVQNILHDQQGGLSPQLNHK